MTSRNATPAERRSALDALVKQRVEVARNRLASTIEVAVARAIGLVEAPVDVHDGIGVYAEVVHPLNGVKVTRTHKQPTTASVMVTRSIGRLKDKPRLVFETREMPVYSRLEVKHRLCPLGETSAIFSWMGDPLRIDTYCSTASRVPARDETHSPAFVLTASRAIVSVIRRASCRPIAVLLGDRWLADATSSRIRRPLLVRDVLALGRLPEIGEIVDLWESRSEVVSGAEFATRRIA